MSLEFIQQNGGAVIYLQQEGRGIGLANKVAAYALQDVGMDTVDANVHLGFPEDCRQYGVVPSILSDMNIGSIRLITNNPRKIDRLQSLGINILDTIPMVVKKANLHNLKYLQTKQDRMNRRYFGEMLLLDLNNPDTASMVKDALNYVIMTPRKQKKSVAEEYINDGKEMAAAPVLTTVYDTLLAVTPPDINCDNAESDDKTTGGV